MAPYPLAVHVMVKTIVGGVTGMTRLLYGSTSPQASLTSKAVVDAFTTVQLPAWIDVLSQEALIVSVSATVYKIPSSGNSPEYIEVINQFGTNASDSMQPYNTTVLMKVPDNSTLSNVAAEDFKAGRFGFMGMGENWQASGLLTSTANTAMNSFSNDLLTIDPLVGGSPVTLPMIMQRYDSALSEVVSVTVQDLIVRPYLGTQNTRKVS